MICPKCKKVCLMVRNSVAIVEVGFQRKSVRNVTMKFLKEQNIVSIVELISIP